MAKVYEIAFQMGGQIAGTFSKTMKGANNALSELQKNISHLNSQQSNIGQLTSLQNSVGKLSREFNQAQQRAQRLGKELSQTTNPTKQQTREFDRARTAAAKLKTRLGDQRMELNRLRNSMGATGKSTRDLVNEQKRLEQQAERARQAQSSLQKTMAAQQSNLNRRGELRGQLFDAGAMALTLAAPIKVAAQFEEQMSKVGAVARASDQEIAQLTKTARDLGATTQFSATQAAEGMQFLAMAGFNAEETMKTMPGMLNLAAAGATDLATTSDIASNVLSGFNMEAAEMGRLGDVLTNAFTSSNTNLQMLGDTMAYVAPVASATGVSLEQTAAMAGKLGDAGIQGSKAGTALRAIMSRLSAPTNEAAKALDQLGIQTQDASGNLRSVPSILADMNSSMSDMGTAARQDVVAAVFGLEAASAATVLLGQAGSGALQTYAKSLEEAGSATRIAKKNNDNAMGAWRRLKSATESVAITLGNTLLPAVASIAESIAWAAGIIDSFAQTFPFVTKVVVGGTAALIALRVATIAGGYAFTFVKGAALSLNVILKTLRIAWMLNTGAITANTAVSKTAIVVSKAMAAAQWLFNAALTANPIGIVIVSITALVAAGITLYKNWDKVTAKAREMWANIKNVFGAMKNFIMNINLFSAGRKIISTLADGVMSKARAIVDSVKGVFQKVRNYLPFSDAKTGPFSDLTKSGSAIMGTLAKGVMGNAELENAVNNKFGKANGGLSAGIKASAGAAGGGRGGITVNLTQQFSIGAGGDGAGIRDQIAQGAEQGVSSLRKMLDEVMLNERRLSYE